MWFEIPAFFVLVSNPAPQFYSPIPPNFFQIQLHSDQSSIQDLRIVKYLLPSFSYGSKWDLLDCSITES